MKLTTLQRYTCLTAIVCMMVIASCTTSRNGCDYHRGKAPKFTAGILKQVDKVSYNKVILHIQTADTMLYVYRNFHYGIGSKKWPVGDSVKFIMLDGRVIIRI